MDTATAVAHVIQDTQSDRLAEAVGCTAAHILLNRREQLVNDLDRMRARLLVQRVLDRLMEGADVTEGNPESDYPPQCP